MIKILFQYIKKNYCYSTLYLLQKFKMQLLEIVDSWLVVDCEDNKLQQSDLRVSFALDVVVVAFMNTGPVVPFPMSYYPCEKKF